jgi:hypothetical protein
MMHLTSRLLLLALVGLCACAAPRRVYYFPAYRPAYFANPRHP